MRPGQNNFKNRNRNRNRRHSGGGNNGGGGGNPNNRVLDSNGPDVKLRGTAQTIAEKYMQLARDAHSSGDRVMAESYYQHADHYYRLWLAAQPAGQPIQFSRRLEEDVEDLEAGDGDEEAHAEAASGEQAEGAEGAADAAPSEGESGEEGQNRNFRNRDQGGRDNRDQGNRDQGNRDQNGNGRERFRNRWPRRNDRNPDQPRDGNVAASPEAQGDDVERAERPERVERVERPDRNERPPRRERADVAPAAEATGDWEAPSFLKRPMPTIADEGADVGDAAPVAAERRPRARRPRYGEEGVTANEPPAVSED